MPPETAKLLHDMKGAAERIGRFVAGKTFNDFLHDELLRSGVERQFEIIGEAVSRLVESDRAIVENISEYRQIAGFRNALIHGYDSIDDDTTWGVITKKLPVLPRELTALLGQ
jgi:uncharacterized protein with HEPN domain